MKKKQLPVILPSTSFPRSNATTPHPPPPSTMTTFFYCFFFLLLLLSPPAKASIFVGIGGVSGGGSVRRVLHQPLIPVDSSPPPAVPAPPEPPQDPTSDWPFFQPGAPGATTTPSVQGAILPPRVPSSSSSYSSSSSNGSSSQQRSDSGRGKLKALLAVAGSIALLLILSCLLLFFFRRSRGASPDEPEKEGARAAPTPAAAAAAVEVMNRRDHGVGASRSVAPMSEIYRPSPELQPMSPLNKAPIRRTPIPAIFSDEETTSYYSPHNTSVTLASEYAPTPDNNNNKHASIAAAASSGTAPASTGKHRRSNSAHSCRTSPRSRLSTSSGDGKVVQSPSHHMPSPAPPPGAVVNEPGLAEDGSELPPPPPPPPPPQPIPRPPKHVGRSLSTPPPMPPPRPPLPPAETVAAQFVSVGHEEEGSCRAVEENEAKPKLKPLQGDKVKASSDIATVWDRLKSGSFQLNENMIETLFVSNGSNTAQKEGSKRPGLPSLQQEDKLLDPKKSQNIAILLRALNVNQEEVTEAVLDGDHGGLSTELLENLVKMDPTKEEKIKLVNYNDDVSKLDSSERFLKSLLDIPFAFKRVDAMVYRANFEAEIKYLMQTFETLEAACEELKTSRLFLKLLEAVLRTGNRMNVGTFRGEAMAFKLDTLLKLVDVKGTDEKTTLLHFVVQEIISSEALGSEDSRLTTKEAEFRKQGLQMVTGLSRDLGNVKKAAGMDSRVIHSYVHKLEMGINKIKEILSCEKSSSQGKFCESMKNFLKEAEEEIELVKGAEHKSLVHVKEVTDYFHGDAAKEEAHPFRIFMMVRDFLGVLDKVCKEVENLEGITMVGAASTFQMPTNASLPGSNRNGQSREESSDEDKSDRSTIK